MTANKNSFTERFSLRLPLVLAPMAGGPTTPELVAAACEAGALGSLACPYMAPSDIKKSTAQVRALTTKPYVINLFAPTKDPVLSSEQITAALQATEKYRKELHLTNPVLRGPYSENFEEQFKTVIELKPAALSFTLGYLSPSHITRAHAAGIYVMGTATTLDEALHLQSCGVDAVIAQGVEAGGHRGIADDQADEPNIGVDQLVKSCVAQLKVPVIAAGGLMSGDDIARVVNLGAAAAQLGTAFLLCPEAGTSAPYRASLRNAQVGDTQLTRAFSGRIARGIKNRFMLEMMEKAEAILPFPAQNIFTRDLRKASQQLGRSDFISLWAGSEVHRLREMKAADLIETLVNDFKHAQQK